MAITYDPNNDPLLQRRWRLLLSLCLVVFTLSILGGLSSARWSWPLFGWGVVVGLVGLTMLELTFWLFLNTTDVPPERKIGLRRRQPLYVCLWLALGGVIGLAAGSLNAVAIDVIAAVFVVMSQALGVVLALRYRKRSTA